MAKKTIETPGKRVAEKKSAGTKAVEQKKVIAKKEVIKPKMQAKPSAAKKTPEPKAAKKIEKIKAAKAPEKKTIKKIAVIKPTKKTVNKEKTSVIPETAGSCGSKIAEKLAAIKAERKHFQAESGSKPVSAESENETVTLGVIETETVTTGTGKESEKKIIMWASVILVMTLIVSIWALNLKKVIGANTASIDNEGALSTGELKDKIGQSVDEMKSELAKIKEMSSELKDLDMDQPDDLATSTLPASASTTAISAPEDESLLEAIRQMKENLEASSTMATSTLE